MWWLFMFDGERLAEFRRDKHMSQEQFVKAINISVAALSKYERGINVPSSNVLGDIACFFKISADYFLGLTDELLSFDKSLFIALPKDSPPELRNDLLKHMELLKKEYQL
ncbi:MAG: helix-turn-helix domain-containing protein [Prevotellaceae bacterium]|jgi:transcriptional regulator with XRE-family HTH domain|nr:helix-turn-helix domain-containing protein [Prevotellaceae bacterium]